MLIAGFGGPDSPEAVGPFMCNLMGREPSPELVARVCARYEEIGGSSPLLDIARQLADGLAAALEEQGAPMPVAVGMRYWEPYVAEAVDALVAQGVELVVMVSLSPYEAEVTHREYRSALDAALERHPGVHGVDAPLLSAVPAFMELQAGFAQEAIEALGMPSAPVIFSAHSLPMSDVERDPAYVRGLEAAADDVAARLGLPAGERGEVLPGIDAFGSAAGERPWLVAYQSQGARGGEWLGPDVDAVIAAAGNVSAGGVVVVPLGFATDHMETRYDLDVLSRRAAEQAGLAFVRSQLPNAHPALSAGIARAVVETVSAHR